VATCYFNVLADKWIHTFAFALVNIDEKEDLINECTMIKALKYNLQSECDTKGKTKSYRYDIM
jgi:hypothetical protein